MADITKLDTLVSGVHLQAALVTPTGLSLARTLGERAFEHRSVKDYGAVGDGTTNDTAAFAAALSAGSVWVPNGTYKITSSLVLTGPRTLAFESRNAVLKYVGAGYCIDADGWRDGIMAGGMIDWTLATANADGEAGAVHMRCHLGSCAYSVIRDMTFIGATSLSGRAVGRYSIRITGNRGGSSPEWDYATYYNFVTGSRFYGADTHVRLVNGTGGNTNTQQPNALRSIGNTYEAYIWGIWIEDSDEHLSLGDWFTGAFAINDYGGAGSETDNKTFCIRLNGVYNRVLAAQAEPGTGASPGKFAGTTTCAWNQIDMFYNMPEPWDNTIGNTEPNLVIFNGIRMPYGPLTIAGATPNVQAMDIATTANGSATTITGFTGLQPTQSLILHIGDAYTSVTTSALLRIEGQPSGKTFPLTAGDVYLVTTAGGVVTMARLYAYAGGRAAFGTMRVTTPAATTLANATDWVKLAGTTEAPAGANRDFAQVANNQLAWAPARSAVIEVTAHLTLSGDTAGTTLDVAISRNAATPPVADELAYGVQARIVATSDRVAVSLTARYASLTQYDNFGVYVKASQACAVTAEKLVMTIREVI